jgi:hypothetical protein
MLAHMGVQNNLSANPAYSGLYYYLIPGEILQIWHKNRENRLWPGWGEFGGAHGNIQTLGLLLQIGVLWGAVVSWARL